MDIKRRTLGAALDHYGLSDRVHAVIIKRTGHDGAENITSSATWAALRMWKFILNGRPLTRAGMCDYWKRTIEVHPLLLKNRPHFENTLLHEVCHALDMLINGTPSRHGSAWQGLMVDFGCKPAATTMIPEVFVEERVKRAWAIWVCQRCGHEASIMRRRKHPVSCYQHPKCGGGQFKTKGT